MDSRKWFFEVFNGKLVFLVRILYFPYSAIRFFFCVEDIAVKSGELSTVFCFFH